MGSAAIVWRGQRKRALREAGPSTFPSAHPVLAGTTADRSAIEAQTALAAGSEALGEAFAAGLADLAAGRVTRAAGDAHPFGRELARAVTQGEVALAKTHAILQAGDRAKPVTQRFAEILQRGAGEFVVALAEDFRAASTFFDPHGTAGDDDRIARRRSRCRRGHSREDRRPQTAFQRCDSSHSSTPSQERRRLLPGVCAGQLPPGQSRPPRETVSMNFDEARSRPWTGRKSGQHFRVTSRVVQSRFSPNLGTSRNARSCRALAIGGRATSPLKPRRPANDAAEFVKASPTLEHSPSKRRKHLF